MERTTFPLGKRQIILSPVIVEFLAYDRSKNFIVFYPDELATLRGLRIALG